MAGNYPDVPAPRMAYDIDGSTGFTITTSNVLSQISNANLATINNEADDWVSIPYGNGACRFGIIFPQLRDIQAYFFVAAVGGANTIETSADTTNGQDGTWTVVTPTLVRSSSVPLFYRTAITTLAMNGIKAIRYIPGGGYDRIGVWHLYGHIAAGETPDRLRLWHPTLDEPLDDNTAADGAHLDWSDIAQGTTADKSFRLKNTSATLTANSISLTTGALTNSTPAIGPQITYSNGGAFSTTLNIGNLAPGALSVVITVRRTTASNAALGLLAWRTIADAGSWS